MRSRAGSANAVLKSMAARPGRQIALLQPFRCGNCNSEAQAFSRSTYGNKHRESHVNRTRCPQLGPCYASSRLRFNVHVRPVDARIPYVRPFPIISPNETGRRRLPTGQAHATQRPTNATLNLGARIASHGLRQRILRFPIFITVGGLLVVQHKCCNKAQWRGKLQQKQ